MNTNCVRDTLQDALVSCGQQATARCHELAGYFDERRFVSDAQNAGQGYCARPQPHQVTRKADQLQVERACERRPDRQSTYQWRFR